MANRRRKFPTFFSIEIGPVRGIAESMGDAEWGTWSKKALSDLSIGCIRKDTDPRVKELFNSSKDRMDTEYQRKHDWYEKKKTAGAPTREDGEDRKSRTPATISQDASTSNGEDDSKVPTSCTVSSKDPVVLDLAYSGEFGNVTLTQEQYNSLLQKFGNKTACDRAIDSLSAKLENGELKARSHYAVLVKWANYRNDKADERNDDGETYLEKNWRKALNNVGMNL